MLSPGVVPLDALEHLQYFGRKERNGSEEDSWKKQTEK